MKLKRTKAILIKIDDFREEKIEDFIAGSVLKRWDDFKKADDLRKAGSLAIINFAEAYVGQNGAIPDEVKEKMAEQSAKVLKKLNNRLQKQLKKKSKSYTARHCIAE